MEIKYASYIEFEVIKEHILQEFKQKFLGVDFEYISPVTLQRVNLNKEITSFISTNVKNAFEAGELNGDIREGYAIDVANIKNEFVKKLATKS